MRPRLWKEDMGDRVVLAGGHVSITNNSGGRIVRFRKMLGGLLLAAGVMGACGAAPERPPNFVVIFIDDMGYGDIGPFGSTVNRTPHLDRMAAEGMKLTSFYAAAPLCTPSRAALLTGSYPKRVGLAWGSQFATLFPGDRWGLHPSEVTIAEVLREAGYATGGFGKWHLGDQPEFLPTAQGFDEYYGIPYSNDMWPKHPRFSSDSDKWNFPPLPLMRDGEVVGRIEDMEDQGLLCQQFTDAAVEFIRRNKDGPFFVYLPHAFIHHPRGARREFLGFQEGEQIDWDSVIREPFDFEVERRTRAQIEEVDWSVGRILDTLRELELADDTLVLFTSDNGASRGSVNTPLRGRKGSTWEGGMREPTLAWWPGRVSAGTVVDEMATTMDLMPTLAGLAGSQAPAERIIDGKDISALLLGEEGARSPHDAFYYYAGYELRAVRSGQWKLHAKDGVLYDLEADIGETTDVAAGNPDVVARLSGYLDDARPDLGDGPDNCPNCRPVGVVENPRTLLPRGKD